MAATGRSEIHRATIDNDADVARLLHDFNTEFDDFTPGLPALTERIAELLRAEAITVLLAGTPPCGLALIRIKPSLWSEATDVYLEELYVAPERRGEGLGRALLEAAIDTARAAGADHIELTTGETDTEARSLYESSGFTNREGAPDGPRMLYYERDL